MIDVDAVRILRCGSTDRLDILGNSTLPGPHASPPGYIGSALMHTANVAYDTPERNIFAQLRIETTTEVITKDGLWIPLRP